MTTLTTNWKATLKEVVRKAGEDAISRQSGMANVIHAQITQEGNVKIGWYTELPNNTTEYYDGTFNVASWEGMEDFDITDEDAQTFKSFRYARHEKLHTQTVTQIEELIQAGNMADATNEMVSLELKLKQEMAENKIDEDDYESFYYINDEEYYEYVKEVMWGYEWIYEDFLNKVETAEEVIQYELTV
jgi:hypothetical protein